jgi:ubiquitin-protein ligase
MVSHKFRDKPTLNRLNKEVGMLNDNFYNCKVLINNANISIFIPIVIEYCRTVMVTITVDYYYPFKPPNVFINNIKYSKILQLISIKYKCTDMCLCCKSITCPGKWKPSCKIQDILTEIFEYHKDITSFLPADAYD